MLETLVNSYHAVGMEEDFHVFSDLEIPGAINHKIETFDKSFFHFKYAFLKNYVQKWNYRYFVFLDADNYFVRKPPSFLYLMENSPVHIFLESDCTLPSKRPIWHRCPLPEYVRLMRECGVTGDPVYNMNAGYFVVKREAVDIFCSLGEDFWKHSLSNGYAFTEEAPMAYAMQMLCDDPQKHLLRNVTDIWCSDWQGHFSDRLPDGKEWLFVDYMNYDSYPVNPAIVHALKDKEVLIAEGRHQFEKLKLG